ncbi:hypothetical protein N7450_001516 [Penicillium hetheringtonii]|uniref:Transcription factor domain-containing protein n=1 Tax=Penicillium hetheringtonii TaxID=911720 RepID=A0AAD6H1H8_9EURO|nr:hypothetical protein N7450_001516 [Penicillium hetheringtonii]
MRAGPERVGAKPRKRKLDQPENDQFKKPRLLGNDSFDTNAGGTTISSELYIDSLLADRHASRTPGNANHPDQLTTIQGSTPNIFLFPAKRVRVINDRRGHNRLAQLLDDIKEVVATKIKTTSSISLATVFREQGLESGHYFPRRDILDGHIQVYFEAVHPIYPFLDPQEFRNQISAPGLLHSLASDKAFAALYYAVVAIGCQNNEGGTFEAGTGEAWSYFEHLALMAMALYSSTASAFQFEPLFLTGAATMAQGLGFNRLNSESEGTLRCTFLVLHDSNISCSIPDVGESNFEDYDWFFSFIKYARLVSKIHTSLFTISAISQRSPKYNARVQAILEELEQWRVSVPIRFRANELLKPRLLKEANAQRIALLTHYLYLHASLTLSWTLLHYSSAKLGATHQVNLKRDLMRTARSVLELTTFIEVSPSTLIWILAVLPLSCLIIIFDLVVHNPEHPETALSLALLDIAGDHFSRLEFASKGTLPGSLLAKFARLARQYVVNQRQRKRQINQENLSTLSMQLELPSAVRATTLAIENPQIATQHAASDSDEQMLASSQAFLVPESISTPRWNVGSTDDSENQLFIPLIDDPSYRVEDLGLLGIDLKYLFDFPHFNPGTESGM